MHPLLLTPILKPKIWGGRRLARFGKSLPAGVDIGESWELADMGSTSASGGGGEAARSVVASGPSKGRTLHEMIGLWGDGLIDRRLLTPGGDFPLLVKFLDAREHLSIQVHPSPAYAAAHPGAHLKTECWFILEADPGAVIYKGLRPGITPELLRRFIEQGRVPEAMLEVPAIPGQMHDLPSGTIHALGAGALVAEVQTPSDTTFRVYDWAKEYGRAGRELHVEQSLECIDYGPAPAATALPARAKSGTLVRNQFYRVDQVRLGRGERVGVGDGCIVLMVVEGAGAIVGTGGAGFGEVGVRAGDTVVVPAGLSGQAEVGAEEGLVVLRAGIGGG